MDKYIKDNDRSIALKLAFKPKALSLPSSPISANGEIITTGTINEEATNTINARLKLSA